MMMTPTPSDQHEKKKANLSLSFSVVLHRDISEIWHEKKKRQKNLS